MKVTKPQQFTIKYLPAGKKRSKKVNIEGYIDDAYAAVYELTKVAAKDSMITVNNNLIVIYNC